MVWLVLELRKEKRTFVKVGEEKIDFFQLKIESDNFWISRHEIGIETTRCHPRCLCWWGEGLFRSND